jgi:2-polyprenyl-3-methyl-5-hydroxy-6-metoxy-1,4-benzoquinol methylase
MTSDVANPIPEWKWNEDNHLPHTYAYIRKGLLKIEPHMKQGARVLDIGCGNGAFTQIYADQQCDVVGVDASPSGIERARARIPAGRFECCQITSTVLEDLGEEPFDFVLSTEVVEHLYAPAAWAEACFQALKPGGVLICSTPYHGYIKNLVLSVFNKWDRHLSPLNEGGHIKFWSLNTITQLLENSGFKVRSHIGVGRFPGCWNSMIISAQRPEQ